jgi:hypothetical protein
MVHLVILFDATSLDAEQLPLVLSEELAVRDDRRFRQLASARSVSLPPCHEVQDRCRF